MITLVRILLVVEATVMTSTNRTHRWVDETNDQAKRTKPTSDSTLKFRTVRLTSKANCSNLLLKRIIFHLICKIYLLPLIFVDFVTWSVQFDNRCNSLVKTNMVWNHKKKQQNRGRLSQSDNLNQDVFICNVVSNGRQNFWSTTSRPKGYCQQ